VPFFLLRSISLIDGLGAEIPFFSGTPVLLHGRDLFNHLRRIQFEVLRRESGKEGFVIYRSVALTRSVRASAVKQLSSAEWKYHTALVLVTVGCYDNGA